MSGSINVLHVDDEPDFASLTAALLERESERFVVHAETDPRRALDAVREADFDCVVSDHDMPGMTGIELLRAIRAEWPDLPFVLFTGKGSEEVASDAVSAGVTEYLQKERGTDQYTVLANRIANVVERYRSQRAAERQKRRLETLVSNLPGVVYRCVNDPGWPMEDVMGECETLTGHLAGDFEAGDVSWGADVIHPADREEVWAAVQAALERGDPFECTYRIRTAAGETKWVWERGRRVERDDGEETLEGFITDVTESKRRARRFEAVFDNTYQFMGLVDPDGTIIEANQPALSFAGVEREDVVGRPLWEGPWFRASEDARRAAREGVETARDGEAFRAEIVARGAERDAVVDFSVRPVTDEDGEVTLLVPEGRDISALKERERALREHERRFEAIFDDPNLLVALLDTDGTTRTVNGTALDYVNATHEDVTGRPFWETPWWSDGYESAVEEWVADAAAGEYVEYEADHPRGDGGTATVQGSFRPVTDADGAVVGIVVSAKDITERRRREREAERRNAHARAVESAVSDDLRRAVAAAREHLTAARDGDPTRIEDALDAVERVEERRAALEASLRNGDDAPDERD